MLFSSKKLYMIHPASLPAVKLNLILKLCRLLTFLYYFYVLCISVTSTSKTVYFNAKGTIHKISAFVFANFLTEPLHKKSLSSKIYLSFQSCKCNKTKTILGGIKRNKLERRSQVSSMIHSARPTVLPVVNIDVFVLFC